MAMVLVPPAAMRDAAAGLRRRWSHAGVALLTASSLNCNTPLNPEYGLPLPADPGQIRVVVREEGGAPVTQVRATVTLPNERGGVFMKSAQTDPAGTVTFRGVPAGRRLTEIVVPPGYSGSHGTLAREVDVLKNRTVEVAFVLVGER